MSENGIAQNIFDPKNKDDLRYELILVNKKKKSDRVLYKFLIPPAEYSMQYGYRINVTKTRGGGWVDDWGADFKTLKLKWEILFTYNLYYGSNPQVSKDDRDGYDEFMALRFILSEHRDVSLTNKKTELLTSYKYFQSRFTQNKNYIDFFKEKSFNTQYEIYYKDYQDNVFEQVLIQNCSYRRSNSDPLSVIFELDLLCLKPIASKDGNGFKTIDKLVKYYPSELQEQSVKSTSINAATLGETKLPDDVQTEIDAEQKKLLDAQSFLLNDANQLIEANKEAVNIAKGQEWFKSLNDMYKGNIYGKAFSAFNFMDFARSVVSFPGKLSSTITKTISFITSPADYVVSQLKNVKSILSLARSNCLSFAAVTRDFPQIIAYAYSRKRFLKEFNDLANELKWSLEPENPNYSTQIINNQYISPGQNVNTALNQALAGNNTNYTAYLNATYFNPPTQTQNNLYNLVNAVNAAIVSVITESEIGETAVDDTQYFYYTVRDGDTLFSLCLMFLGTLEASYGLAQVNNISARDFDNDGMVGKQIKIPYLDNRDKNFFLTNWVFGFKKNDVFSSLSEMELFYFGIDLKLDNDRNLMIDASGDLDILMGYETWLANVIDIVNLSEGELNELNPNLGISDFGGAFLTDYVINDFKSHVESVALADPRTKTARVGNIKAQGDAIYYEIDLVSQLNNDFTAEILTKRSVIYGNV